jgi:hypothetical protein
MANGTTIIKPPQPPGEPIHSVGCPGQPGYVPPELTRPGDPYYPGGYCFPQRSVYNPKINSTFVIARECFPGAPFGGPIPPECNSQQVYAARTQFLITQLRRNAQLAPPTQPPPTTQQTTPTGTIIAGTCTERLPGGTGQCGSTYWIKGTRVTLAQYQAAGYRAFDPALCTANPCTGY